MIGRSGVANSVLGAMNMVRRLALIALMALALPGCTHLYSHRFAVESTVPGTQIDEREVFLGFSRYLSETGMPQVPTEKPRDDYVAFQFGGGRSGIFTRSPYREHIELSYALPEGFVIRLVRIIRHPVDFSSAQLELFKRETERFLTEALPNVPKLKVVERATQPNAPVDTPQAATR